MISFVVPAYNEERVLGAALDGLHAAALGLGEPYEVVVADDASTDRTAAIAEGYGARVIRLAHRQIAATRNSGARHAKGDLLFFVDADTIVNADVVRAAVEALRGGAVGGGATGRFDEPVPFYGRLLVPFSAWLMRTARLAAGCFLFCTRRAFEAAGGFDETFYAAEEVMMALKRQGRFVVLRQTVITSGRKLRTHSGWELLRLLGRLALRGPGIVRDRRDMALWYGERRDDPSSPPSPS